MLPVGTCIWTVMDVQTPDQLSKQIDLMLFNVSCNFAELSIADSPLTHVPLWSQIDLPRVTPTDCTLCSKKSDAKIQITITMAYLIRIKYPLSGFNYHLSDLNVANFNKIQRTVSEQQLFKKWNLKTEVSNMENTDSEQSHVCPTWKRRDRYQPSVSCVLGPFSQNLSWSRSPCRYLELPN